MIILGEDSKEELPIAFPRYALKFPDLSPYVEDVRADCLSKRRSQRYRNFIKKVNMDFLREELNATVLVHLVENTMYQPPQQPYQPPPQAQAPPPMPSQQEMWSEIQRLRNEAQQNQQAVAEYQKKERQSGYRVRRAKGSGNLSFNWGDTLRGAYLTPSKFQDGRVTLAGAGMPATIQLQNTAQGPFIIATITNGPLNQEEVELYNEWFVKPVEVIPARRGPRTGQQPGQSPPPQTPPQLPLQTIPQQPLLPVQQQFPAQAPQYPYPAPPPQQPLYAPPPTANTYQSIAHLDQNTQNALMQEATTLQKSAPQAYPSLELALAAVKRAKNIP